MRMALLIKKLPRSNESALRQNMGNGGEVGGGAETSWCLVNDSDQTTTRFWTKM
jgi:hypothetical protein